MNSELATANSLEGRFVTSSVPALEEPKLALADVRVPEISALMRMPSDVEMARALQQNGVAPGATLTPGDDSANLSKLSRYGEAFFPTLDTVHFALALLAAIQNLFRARQFGNNEFLRFFFANSQLRKNATLIALPTCIQELCGGVFALSGASGSGKSAFIRRFCAYLPKPFFLKEAPAPSMLGIWVFPVLRLFFPTCGTVRGLVRDMRQQILSVTGTVGMEENPLPDMLLPKPENAAITACLAVNVGMVILEGASIRNSNTRAAEILAFLLKLRNEGGIPVLISCTAAFQQSVEHLQSDYRNLFGGLTLYLEPFERPSEPSADGTAPDDGDAYRHLIKCFWSSGLVPKGVPVPPRLATLAHDATAANTSFTAIAMKSLQVELATSGDVDYCQLDDRYINRIVEDSLRPFKGPIEAIRVAKVNSPAVHSNIINYVDYFPESITSKPRIKEWLIPQSEGGKR